MTLIRFALHFARQYELGMLNSVVAFHYPRLWKLLQISLLITHDEAISKDYKSE